MLVSGLLISQATALAAVLVLLGRLQGPLPLLAGALGGALALPVLASQLVALRLRPDALWLSAVVVPWAVAVIAALAGLATGRWMLGHVPLSEGSTDHGYRWQSCQPPPGPLELSGARWSVRREHDAVVVEVEASRRMRFELGRGDEPPIAVRCSDE